jgi:hypothetical protein
MPFTISHAAAVIPFRRTPLIMSALIMGSFVPDYPHLLSFTPHTAFSHSLLGMFVDDLPLAIVALGLFHIYIKQPMLMFLPDGFLRRLATSVDSFAFLPLKRFLMIVLSILIGTATHLLWDEFTHRDSLVYKHWAFLQQSVELPVVGEMQMCKLLEYASSVFGLVVVALWIWCWYRTTRPTTAPVIRPLNAVQRRTFVVVLPVLAILGGLLRAYGAVGIHLQIRPFMYFTTDTLVMAIAYFLLGLFAYGVILHRHNAAPAKA